MESTKAGIVFALQHLGTRIESDTGSRWHPKRERRVHSLDRIGDDLIERLWSVCETLDHLSDSVSQQLNFRSNAASFVCCMLSYERESCSLVKLANTGHIVELIERFHRWIDSLSRGGLIPPEDIGVGQWRLILDQERKDRALHYEYLLSGDDGFRALIEHESRDKGIDEQQYYLELMTLLKHDQSTNSARFLPEERTVTVSVFEKLTRHTCMIAVTVPSWFASPMELGRDYNFIQWHGGHIGLHYAPQEEDEEVFLTNAALWRDFNHPHVAKLFAACHVGARFYIHEHTNAYQAPDPLRQGRYFRWESVYQCVLGLQHMHQCGTVYREFSSACILQTPASTRIVLRGNGIIARNDLDESQSFANDLHTLAEAAFASIKMARSTLPDNTDLKTALAKTEHERPTYVSPDEWLVLGAMWSCVSDDQSAVLHILQQLQSLTAANRGIEAQFLEGDPDRILADIAVDAAGHSLENVFAELSRYFETGRGVGHDMNLHVWRRLVDIYHQIREKHCVSLPTEMVAHFRAVVARFYHSTVSQSSVSSYISASATCAARTIASRNYSYHHEIDRLLGYSVVHGSSVVHEWIGIWKRDSSFDIEQARLNLSGLSESVVVNASSDEDESKHERRDADENVEDLMEAAVVMGFETTRRRGAYLATDLQELKSAHARLTRSVGPVVVPEWFLPSHEIELGDYIAGGAFGSVYHGKWFGTDVVVKMLLDTNSPEQRREFVREADIWFLLNHPNIVKLYGACHVGPRPFFVCELAEHGILPTYLHSARYRMHVWQPIYEAAVGLRFLHDRGIVHADLKGNNILVGANRVVKLTDFGLSRVARPFDPTEVDGEGAKGAYRWKAPECLKGSSPTFASDVYSFAMCIIEAVSGVVPFGIDLPDAAVKVHIIRGELPARPETIDERVWELIEHMTCLDPTRRIDMAAVVEALSHLREYRSGP